MQKILDVGFLLPSTQIKNKYSVFGGEYKYNNIYANIYFEELKNIGNLWNYSIIISPKVVEKQNIEYHDGWGFLQQD